MSDMERLDRLSSNLRHSLVDIRLRAAQNLQFKLLSNVLGDGIYSSSTCMTSLANGISGSIQMLISGNDWQLPSSSSSKLMEELLLLTQTIGKKSNMTPETANESFAKLIDDLYTVFSKCENTDPMHKLAEKVNYKSFDTFLIYYSDDYSLTHTSSFSFTHSLHHVTYAVD